MTLCLATATAGLLLLPASADVPAPLKQWPKDTFECRWADTPIVIDGKLDDAAWKHAEVIDSFFLPWLKDKARPVGTATKARLLWDREHLYFAAEMEDIDVAENDDQLFLFLKPAIDKPGYYEFQASPTGALLGMFWPQRVDDTRFRRDADFQVNAKATIDGTLNKNSDRDKGWTIEGCIAWRNLLRAGGRPGPGDEWRFALCRKDGGETSTCAPLKTENFHAHEGYAGLRFISPDTKTSRPYGIAQRVPVTGCTVVGAPDPPPPYRMERRYGKLKLDFPIAACRQPGADLILIIDQQASYGPTRLARFRDHAGVVEAEKLMDLSDTAYDICFHPKFAENGYVYIGSNGARKGEKKMTRVTRYRLDRKPPHAFDAKSAAVIIEWESDGHNGAAICFGHDGMMYVTSGDGTSDSDTNVVGQRMDTLLAKVLRIDVDHPDANKQYSVPKDNPFVNMKDAKPETWAIGLRNPWRMTTDAKTGHIWVGQNGQDLWEQAFLVRKGDNYGWSVTEGSHPFYPNRQAAPAPIVKPTIEHHHSEFRSLTGGIVYYGKKFPELQGAYIYGDYSTGKIWGMKHDGTKPVWHKELADSHLQISGFAVDADGELLVADHRGQGKGAFYTFVATPKDLPPSTFPRKLSDSGLFEKVAGHRMKAGVIPYSVNSPLWSDGAHKERFMFVPSDQKIDMTRTRGWNFPDLTVLVKSFALETEPGDPASRKWIETRFLTKQHGEWYGYSYVWNDEQSDAELVEAKGADREYVVRVPRSRKHPDGQKKVNWRYPSRAECMVCHSRAANYVLGLTELQMNREHDYNGVKDNQLRVLEHLNLIRGMNWAEDARNSIRESLKSVGKAEKEINEFVSRQNTPGNQKTPGQSAMLSMDPAHYKKLVDPYDAKQSLNARARSYLHANCAHCHVEAGGGNAQMDLEFTASNDKFRVLDVKPVHHTFGLTDAKLVVPGRPERSVLLHRIANRKEGHMPPLATREIDRDAVRLLEDWIRSMDVAK
jgi:uncharacterized repeat protein (TIGR03806 family)